MATAAELDEDAQKLRSNMDTALQALREFVQYGSVMTATNKTAQLNKFKTAMATVKADSATLDTKVQGWDGSDS